MQNASPRPSRALSRSALASFLLLLVVAVLVAAVRVRLAGVPLERDEGEYAYAGRLLLDGVPPYARAYNMKFPGIYAAYAGILAVFGQSPSGIRIGLLILNLGTGGFVFLLGRRFLRTWVAALAGATYLVLATSPSVLGLFGHATHFILLPVVAGMWLLCPPFEEASNLDLDSGTRRRGGLPRRRALFAAGACFGLAVLLKQHAMFYPVLGALVIAWRVRTAQKVTRDSGPGSLTGGSVAWQRPGWLGGIAQPLSLFGAGVILPLVITAILLLATGVWSRFWFWTFAYAREYVSITPVSEALGTLLANGRHVMRGSESFWILALLGMLSLTVPTSALPGRTSAEKPGIVAARRGERIVLFGLFGASFFAIVPGFYFRPHYFILLLPPVALLAAVGIETLSRGIVRAFRAEPLMLISSFALFAAATALQLATWRDVLFEMTPHEVSRSLYGPDPFPEAEVIAEYIRRETSENDSIAVVGSEPEIYFLAERPAATGYLYTYALMEPQRFARRMQEEMMGEIAGAHPKVLVYPQIGTSWGREEMSDPAVFDWIGRYTRDCYDLVGIVDVHSPDRSTILWGPEARSYRPQSENLVFVFRRKSDAPCS